MRRGSSRKASFLKWGLGHGGSVAGSVQGRRSARPRREPSAATVSGMAPRGAQRDLLHERPRSRRPGHCLPGPWEVGGSLRAGKSLLSHGVSHVSHVPQLFQIDTAGCMEVVRERKARLPALPQAGTQDPPGLLLQVRCGLPWLLPPFPRVHQASAGCRWRWSSQAVRGCPLFVGRASIPGLRAAPSPTAALSRDLPACQSVCQCGRGA